MLVFGAMNASAQLTVYHNGNVSLQAEQTVRLKNSFRVEKGASLQVHTNLK